MNRRQFALALPVAAALAAPRRVLAQPPSAALLAAVGDPRRTPALKARDAFRHPAETLAFWGLAPGMTVVEIAPSGGYWTEILAPWARATGGRYVAALDPKPEALAKFQARFGDAAIWGPISYAAFAPGSGAIVPDGAADLLITARNLHDWMDKPGELDSAFAAFAAAVHKGGLMGVEEHRADPRPMVPGASDGYMNTAFVADLAAKAGFRLDAQSEINANPRDTKDYPFGVWTLPPTRRGPKPGAPVPAAYDRARYDAIGESDRMTLRFTRG